MTELNVTAVASKDATVNLVEQWKDVSSQITSDYQVPSGRYALDLFHLDPNNFLPKWCSIQLQAPTQLVRQQKTP